MPNPAQASDADQERNILAQLRRGNTTAAGELLSRYQDRLYAVMLRMTNNPDDAAELVQETFVRALGNVSRFQGNASLYTWIFRIALNLALSLRRTQRRRGTVSLDAQQQPLDHQADTLRRQFAQSTEPDPADAAASSLDHQSLLQALEGLEEDLKAILVLRDVEDASYAQIGEMLEIPEGTVKSRLFRARVALRHALGANSPVNPPRPAASNHLDR